MDRANCRSAQLEMGDVHKVECAISDKNRYVISCLRQHISHLDRSRSSGP